MAAAEQAEALKQQQQVAAQRQAAEAAEQEKKEELARLLTIQPTDSPEVRVQVHRAKRRQQGLAFDEQRVQVAEHNLMPLARARSRFLSPTLSLSLSNSHTHSLTSSVRRSLRET